MNTGGKKKDASKNGRAGRNDRADGTDIHTESTTYIIDQHRHTYIEHDIHNRSAQTYIHRARHT